MRIVCWQTILMKYHTLFFLKIRKDISNLSPAAVVIGALRVNGSFLSMGGILYLVLILRSLRRDALVCKISCDLVGGLEPDLFGCNNRA